MFACFVQGTRALRKLIDQKERKATHFPSTLGIKPTKMRENLRCALGD